MMSKLKPWLILAVIFVAGILTGIAVTVAFPARFIHPPQARESKNHLLDFLSHRLKLTPDQTAKVQPITEDAEAKLRSLHHEEVERGSEIFKAMDDQIAAVLNPDQKAELQKLETEREKMFGGHPRPWGNQRDHEGNPPPPAPPAPPPPPPPPPADGGTPPAAQPSAKP